MNDSNGLARRRFCSARLAPAVAALAVLVAACGQNEPVEPALAGSWEIAVPGGRWVLTIDTSGRYVFANEAGGTAPSHSGEFAAQDGEWSLRSTTMALEDAGTYELAPGDGLQLAGNLGSLRRAAARPVPSIVETVSATVPAAQQFVPTETPRANAQPAAAQPGASLAPMAGSGSVPEIVDPCLLVTPDEAKNVLGTAVSTERKAPQPRTQNDCFYRGSGRMLSVTSYNGGGLDTAGYLEQKRSQGGEKLAGIGDGAYLTYRDATGLTQVDFVIGSGVSGDIGLRRSARSSGAQRRGLATQAAYRMTTSAAAFRIPGVERFVGTWLVTTQGESASSGYPSVVFWVERDGNLRLQTSGGFSGTMLLTGTSWRLEDGFNQTPPTGQYRLRGDQLTLQGPVLEAELTRVACGQQAATVRPPYDLTRDMAAFLSGRNLSLLSLQQGAADPFDVRLAGLWEGEGTLDIRKTQVLASIDSRGRSVLAVFPTATGRLQASEGNYQLSLSGQPDSHGTYRFPGGTSDGLIYFQEGDKTLIWTPYDPSRRPPYDMPIVGHCN